MSDVKLQPCGNYHTGRCGTDYHTGRGHGNCKWCDVCKEKKRRRKEDEERRTKKGGRYSSNSDDCFITTATLRGIGKPDDCEELNKFRWFRDNWLSKQEHGMDLIEEYYIHAPEIVKAINRLSDHKTIYNNLWKSNIMPCLDLIENGKFEEAMSMYCSVVLELRNRYLPY